MPITMMHFGLWTPLKSAALALVLIFGFAAASHAQDETAAPDESVPAIAIQDLEALVAILDDPEARAEFMSHLRTLAKAARKRNEAAEPVPESLVSTVTTFLATRTTEAITSARQLLSSIVDVPNLANWFVLQVTLPTNRAYWFGIFATTIVVLGAGVVAHWLADRLLAGLRRRIRAGATEFVTQRIRGLALMALVECGSVVAFAIASIGALQVAAAAPLRHVVILSLVIATITAQLVLIAVRAVLAPGSSELRAFSMTDEMADHLYVWMRWYSWLVTFTYMLFHNNFVLMIPSAVSNGIQHVIGLVVAIMIIILVLRSRYSVAGWLAGTSDQGSQSSPIRRVTRLFAGIWHIVAIIFVLADYLIWALQIPGGFAILLRGAVVTILLLVIEEPVTALIRRLLSRGIRVKPELRRRYPGLQPRLSHYAALLSRASVFVVDILLVVALLYAWSLDPIALAYSWLGEGVIAAAGRILLIVLLIVVLWEAMNLAISIYLGAADETGAKVERSGRVRTMLPLMRTALAVTIGIIVILTTLTNLGVNIAPLLAAAGVVGIAIGFGSQKLVQDVINGIFILFQNIISVGDVVEIAGHAGLVERLSVRTIELRDLEGSVHTIPYGEVTTIRNMTRDFSFALLDVGVAYREDVDEVMEVLRQLGAELEQDLEYGQFILEPIEILGVDSFADSAVIIKARIKTKALKQWFVRREFNRLMKRRFDELGIEIPFPHQTIYFGEDKHGAAPPATFRVMERGDVEPQRRQPETDS